MLIGVAAFLLLFFAFLATPVSLVYKMTWHQDFQSDIKLLWLFGLVRIHIHQDQKKLPLNENNNPVQNIQNLENTKSKSPKLFHIIRQKEFRQRTFKFISDIWRSIQKRDISLHMRLGLGDPADTGLLWAFVGPTAGILTNIKEISINIEPDFYNSTFELDSQGNIRFIPLQVIYLAIGLLLSPCVWHGIKQIRSVGN